MLIRTKAARALAWLALAALAAGALGGCGAASGPAASGMAVQPDQTAQPAANPLDDGRLRYLYPAHSSGGGTLLRGAEVLYKAAPSERITLLYAPDEAAPAGWQLGKNEAEGGRVTEVYDAGGALLWRGEGEWQAALAGTMLALTPGGFGVDYGPGGATGCRLIDTAAGREYALPAEASGCIPTAYGQAVLTLNSDPEAGALEGSSVAVLDLATGEEVYRVDAAYAYRAYGSERLSRCAAIQRCETDPATGEQNWFVDLYDPATRTVYSRFETFCGADLICYQPEPGRYEVCRLGETGALASYDGRCVYWRADAALIGRDDGYHLVTPEGEQSSASTYAVNGEEAAFLLADGTLLLYGPGGRSAVETGLAGSISQTGFAGDYWTTLNSVADGYALLYTSDAACPDGHCQIYSAAGLVYDSAGSGYESLSYLTMGPDGPLYAASRQGVGGGWLADVVDSRGAPLLTGLAELSAGDELPEGVLAARRGFTRGYLDLAGNWLYSESAFASLADEDGAYYW